MARVSRMAESYYFNNLDGVKDNTYTIVVPGMNHWQFCGEGLPPPNVVKVFIPGSFKKLFTVLTNFLNNHITE